MYIMENRYRRRARDFLSYIFRTRDIVFHNFLSHFCCRRAEIKPKFEAALLSVRTLGECPKC
jgi:hypothetical protein